MVEFKLVYEEELCSGCGNCVIACPINMSLDERVLGGKGGGSELRITNGIAKVEIKLCNGCGLCVEACSFNALKLELKEPKLMKRMENIFEEVKEEKKEITLETKEIKYAINEKLLQNLNIASESLSTGVLRRILEEEQKITSLEIRSLIEAFEKHGNVFGILDEYIIARNFCSFCGACVSACPEEAIEIVDATPRLIKECTNCAACMLRCPKTALVPDLERKTFGEVSLDKYLGFYKKALSARSAKKEILLATQEGGVATSLLVYALEKGIIDCAIVTKGDGKKTYPIIATSAEEIISAAEIKFTISPNASLLREAVKRGYRKIAVVAAPCQVIAFRKFQLLGFNEIKLILGVFCPRGSHYIKGTPAACLLCNDFTAELSDISLGSIGSPRGWRSLLIRSEIGGEIVNEAIKLGYLQANDLSDEDIKVIAKVSKRKKETAKKNREELFSKYETFEKAVKLLGSLNVRYLSEDVEVEYLKHLTEVEL